MAQNAANTYYSSRVLLRINSVGDTLLAFHRFHHIKFVATGHKHGFC